MTISTVKKVVAFCLTVLLLNNFNAYAQPATSDKNPHRDPMVMVPGYTAPQGKAAEATVITIGDYDNFKLGVDFAECSITINPLNPLEMYAVWNTTGTAGGKGYRTVNGYDWAAANPSWTGMKGDVVVASDSTGRLIYENMYGSISGCKVTTSTDFGLTWDPVVIAISGIDKNWIAADQTGGTYSNYIYTVMTANPGGNHARSINNGVSFTNTQNMATQSSPGMMVAVGPKDAIQGGAVYVVTNSSANPASPQYTFYESNDGGQSYTYKSAQNFANYVGTYSGSRNSVENMRTRPYPFIAADNSNGPHRGRLYLVYASNFPAGNYKKPDIFCRYSDNGGTSWSSAKTVNDDTNSEDNNNWFPAIWNDPKTGRLYISWMDTRDCPTSDSALIYATYTEDGETFLQNQQLSTKKMKINCTSCGGGGTPMYLGDYNGIGANGVTSVMAWTDFRDNNFGSYVGYFPDYGLRAEPAIDTVTDAAVFYAKVPSVKLYTDTVFVSASVAAAPGLFSVTYPEGNMLWTYPGEIPIKIISNNAPVGDYVVTITTTGSNGTPVHKRTTTVRVVASVPPVANFTVDNTNPCESQPVHFTDLSIGPPSGWEWTFAGGTPATSTAQNPIVTYSESGTYSVTLKVTNQMGTNTLTFTDYITVRPSPDSPVASSQSVCYGQPVPDLTATGTDLQWYSQGILAGTGPTYTTGQTSTGIYNYTVTQTADGCESLPTTVTLTINELPAVYLNLLDTVCASDPAFDLTGGTPVGGSYSGTGITNGLLFDPAVAGAGDHSVTYQYTDGNGCSNSFAQTITVKPIPIVTIDAVNPLCVSAAPVVLTAQPAGGIYSGAGVSGDTLYPAIAGSGAVNVTYTYNDPVTGCPGTATQIVTINALPDIAIDDSTICGNRKLFYDVTVSNPQSYFWTPGGVTTPILQIDTVGQGLGAHTYYVTVTDANGCITADSAVITFYDCTGIEELPDSKLIELYPNPGSGQFAIRSQSIPAGKYDLIVFNAVGKQVYSEIGLKIENEFLHTLNLTHLENGIYIMVLKNRENSLNKRFIINK